jgi:hypothetical protein
VLFALKHFFEVDRLDLIFINDGLFNQKVLLNQKVSVCLLNQVVLLALKQPIVHRVHALPILDNQFVHGALLPLKVMQLDLLAIR